VSGTSEFYCERFEGEIASVERTGVGSGDATEIGPPIGVGLTGGSAVGVDCREGNRVGRGVPDGRREGGLLVSSVQAMMAQKLTTITARVTHVL